MYTCRICSSFFICRPTGSGPPEEDELYEDYMAETNCVYRVEGEELSPLEEFSGQLPRYDMLDDEQVLQCAAEMPIKDNSVY